MKILLKLYKYYNTHLPDSVLFFVGAYLIFLLKDVPYINLVILNLDPIFSVMLLLWLLYYFRNKPSSVRVLKIALIILAIVCLLVLLRTMEIASIIASISFVMIFTAAIKELVSFKGIMKNQPNLFAEKERETEDAVVEKTI